MWWIHTAGITFSAKALVRFTKWGKFAQSFVGDMLFHNCFIFELLLVNKYFTQQQQLQINSEGRLMTRTGAFMESAERHQLSTHRPNSGKHGFQFQKTWPDVIQSTLTKFRARLRSLSNHFWNRPLVDWIHEIAGFKHVLILLEITN